MRLIFLFFLILLESCIEVPSLDVDGDAVPQGDIEITSFSHLTTDETIKLKTVKGEDELTASMNPAVDSLILICPAQGELMATWEGVIKNHREQFRYGFIEWRGETELLFGNSFASNRKGQRMQILTQADSLAISFSD